MRYFHSASLLVIALALPACDKLDEQPTGPSVQFNSSGNQQATGSGRFAVLPFIISASFEVSAHSDLGGANPRGNAAYAADQDLGFSDFDVRGRVTCLTVVGNKAAIGIKVTRGTFANADVSGQGIVVVIQDNGPPGHGAPDGITNGGFAPGEDLNCAAYIGWPATTLITSGNFVVKQ